MYMCVCSIQSVLLMMFGVRFDTLYFFGSIKRVTHGTNHVTHGTQMSPMVLFCSPRYLVSPVTHGTVTHGTSSTVGNISMCDPR